jgi:hypothetical protein
MLGIPLADLHAAIVVISLFAVTSIVLAAGLPNKVTFIGGLRVNSALIPKRVFFSLSGVGIIPNTADDANHTGSIFDQPAQSRAPMRIRSRHKIQRDMQVGSKSGQVGWGRCEVRGASGAIVATGHEHADSSNQIPVYFEIMRVTKIIDTFTIGTGNTSTHDRVASHATCGRPS